MNLFLLAITFLIVGFLECFFWSLQTKSLIRDKMINTFIFTFMSITIWIYVVSKVAENINNIWLGLGYATGCSIGNVATIKLDRYIDKIARGKLWKKSKKKKIRRTIKKK